MKSWREELLAVLESSGNDFVNGQDLASRFGCSRAAIWKKISTLRDEGHPIEASTNRGYRLRRPDAEFERQVKASLEKLGLSKKFQISVTDMTSSTNYLAREAGAGGCADSSVFVAMHQSDGRGRRGRTWISNTDEGLWFSILIRPTVDAKSTSSLTLLFGLCILEALQSLCALSFGIKWPNDIISLLNGKKVCGILSETSMEDNRVSYAVIGCGINVMQSSFPEEIASVATSIRMEGAQVSKADLLSAILHQVSLHYPEFEKAPGAFLSRYRANCATLGRYVRIESEPPQEGTAIGISDAGDLIVQKKDGSILTLTSGEVSVRGMLGYL